MAMARRAFRRPVTDEEIAGYVAMTHQALTVGVGTVTFIDTEAGDGAAFRRRPPHVGHASSLGTSSSLVMHSGHHITTSRLRVRQHPTSPTPTTLHFAISPIPSNAGCTFWR